MRSERHGSIHTSSEVAGGKALKRVTPSVRDAQGLPQSVSKMSQRSSRMYLTLLLTPLTLMRIRHSNEHFLRKLTYASIALCRE